jgi:hypothetical protein
MRLIGFAVVLGVSLTLAPFAFEAQPQSGKVYRIGILSSVSTTSELVGPNPKARPSARSCAHCASLVTCMESIS